jgi:hypothetical protein
MLNSPAAEGNVRVPSELLIISAALNVLIIGLLLPTTASVDYFGFYSAGKLSLSSPSLIFNEVAQRATQFSILGRVPYLPFLHVPDELLIFAPLSLVSFRLSRMIWFVINIGLLIGSVEILSRISNFPRRSLFLIFLAMPPIVFGLRLGQDSILMLFIMALSLVLLRKNHDVTAGAVLALALFKPQVVLVIALALLANKRWRFVFGFSVSAFAIAAASMAVFGRSVFIHLAQLAAKSQDPRFMQSMSIGPSDYPTLRGLTHVLGISPLVAVVLSAVLIASLFTCALQKPLKSELLFSISIIVGSLSAFNWHHYDLVLLLIPFAVLENHSQIAEWCLLFSPIMAFLAYFGLLPLLCLPLAGMLMGAIPEMRR